MALLQYINANKGKFPPTAVTAGNPGVASPDGWWWATELVAQKYINAPNIYAKKVGVRDLSGNTSFRCPEGKQADDGKGSGASASYPTDTNNNGWQIYGDSNTSTFGIASWYMLNSANLSNGNRLNIGNSVSPFIYFNNTDATAFAAPERQRYMRLVRKASEMVMIIEAADANATITASGTSASYPDDLAPRIGARHGQKTGDGLNAYTNLAFFDGHVALYPTKPFGVSPLGLRAFYRDTIFYLNNDK